MERRALAASDPVGVAGWHPGYRAGREELKQLRGEHQRFTDISLGGIGQEAAVLLDSVQGDTLELLIRFAPTTTRRFGALVRCSYPQGNMPGYRTEIAYDRTSKRLVDTPLELPVDQPLVLRIFLDRSVVGGRLADAVHATLAGRGGRGRRRRHSGVRRGPAR